MSFMPKSFHVRMKQIQVWSQRRRDDEGEHDSRGRIKGELVWTGAEGHDLRTQLGFYKHMHSDTLLHKCSVVTQFQQSVQASYREQGRDYICV